MKKFQFPLLFSFLFLTFFLPHTTLSMLVPYDQNINKQYDENVNPLYDNNTNEQKLAIVMEDLHSHLLKSRNNIRFPEVYKNIWQINDLIHNYKIEFKDSFKPLLNIIEIYNGMNEIYYDSTLFGKNVAGYKDFADRCFNIVSYLLDKKSNVNVVSINRAGFYTTPLIESCCTNADGCNLTTLLLKHGANPNLAPQRNDQNNSKNLPILYAMAANNLAQVKLLIKYNASVDVIDSEGKSLLEYAYYKKNSEAMDFIVHKSRIFWHFIQISNKEPKLLNGVQKKRSRNKKVVIQLLKN